MGSMTEDTVVAEDVLLARAYLSRVAEPGCLSLWRHVRDHGPLATVEAVRSGDVPEPLRRATTARAGSADPHADLEAAHRHGIHLLTPESDGWPHVALSALEGTGRKLLTGWRPSSAAAGGDVTAGHLVPPLALWVRGSLPLAGLSLRSVAVVGARNATPYGDRIAKEFARRLALRNFDVISGGAFGIDAAAHRGALAAGGRTVLVSARGLDAPYPSANRLLFDQVAESGALVAEVPPGCAPHRGRFLSRNRLIAAFGTGTLVVEAAHRSGARNTASHCIDLDRPLMVVPGPVSSELSAGCHELLIRYSGTACLVAGVQHVLDVIGGASDIAPAARIDRRAHDDLDPVSAQVMEGMPGRGAITAESLAQRSGVPEEEIWRTVPALVTAGLLTVNGHRLTRRVGARS